MSLTEDRFNEILEESMSYYDLGRYDDCIEMLSEAIAYARLLNRGSHLVRLMIKRADSYYHKGDYSRAIQHCKKVAQYVDLLGLEDRVDLYEIQAISLAHLGDYEEAIKQYQTLLNIPVPGTEFKAYVGLGLVYYHQARYYQQLEKYDTAIFYYEKALKLKDLDFRNITMVLHNIGMVYYEKGYYQKALSRYSEALRFNVQEYLPYTYNELGKVYIRLEQLEKASDYIDKAALILSETEYKDHIEIARNFFVKALYYKALKEYDTAIFFFKLALNELKDKEILAEIAEVYQELATIYKDSDPDLSIDYLVESKFYFKMLR